MFSPNEDDLSYSARTIFPDYIKMVKTRQTLFLRTFRTGRTHFLSDPCIASESTQWGKPSNVGTFWVYPLRPRAPSWTWIRCMQSATYRNTFMSPLTFAMSTATRNSLRHPATSFMDNIIWRLSCHSPTTTRTTHLWVTTSFLSLNSKHNLLLHQWRRIISPRHSTMP